MKYKVLSFLKLRVNGQKNENVITEKRRTIKRILNVGKEFDFNKTVSLTRF